MFQFQIKIVIILFVYLITCQIFKIHSFDSIYTYPLGKNIEVMEIAANQLSGVKGNVGYASGHPDLLYDSFLIKGCRNSYIDIPIPTGRITGDIALVLFVYPQAPLQGTILHYKASTWSTDNSDIKISLAGSTLLVSFTGGNGTIDYGTVSFPGKIGSDQWIALSLSRDKSNGKLAITINSTVLLDDDKSYPDDVQTALPGTLRIGGSQDVESRYFNGRITCLNVLNNVFNKPNEIQKIQATCSTGNWPITNSTVTDSCTATKGFYKVNINDKSPNSSISTLNMMSTASSIQCADLCSRTLNCKSFVIHETNKICKLFDKNYEYDLQSYPGAKYYTFKDECC
ncbi:hypothetical protein ACJMK2_027588 [Sinanodonta woodiana]|uniref:Apple domain-containing protein n=1 Tax=Sinanodonta woodiana TaxID=1069815 RepID=A0ABD3X5W9_SINWO